ARHFTNTGTALLWLGPLVFLINLAVYLLMRFDFPEPVIWLTIFSMYPALFSVFLVAPPGEAGEETSFRLEMWSTWGGKMFAAIAISVALRMTPLDLHTTLGLVYVVFAALSGMAGFVLLTRTMPKLSFMAGGWWLVGIIMACWLEWAPLLYGTYCLCVL